MWSKRNLSTSNTFCPTLLSYPGLNRKFDIHTDAIDYQLGTVIIQEGKPIAFYIRKSTDLQTRYTVTEEEYLSLVETLKEFCAILLGQRLKIYTKHKNMMCKNFNANVVLRWRFILE